MESKEQATMSNLDHKQSSFELTKIDQSQLIDHKFLNCDCFEPVAKAIVTTRLHGSSQAPYDHFNVAHHVGDNLEQVCANRQYIKDYFKLDHLVFMEQTHSSEVKIIKSNEPGNYSALDADGIVCNEPKVGLAVMTADCLPLLLCDPINKVVGAVHCGWKGILKGIIEVAITKMQELGASREHIKAYLGPAIGSQSFEVGQEVKELFEQDFAKTTEAFEQEFTTLENGQKVKVDHKFMCDIYALCSLYLQKSLNFDADHQDKVIFGGGFDTKIQNNIFYSYRHQNKTGRLASIIWLQ